MGGDDADVAPPQNVPTKPKDGEVRIGNPDRVHPTRPDVESADPIGTGAASDAAAHLNRVDAAALRESDATTEKDDGCQIVVGVSAARPSAGALFISSG